MNTYFEFFAGGGMARAGLGTDWQCLFANDFDHKKAVSYKENWGDKELKVADVATLSAADLPGQADLVWASFPCQDLSLAGGGAGLKGERSGTFKPFWKLMQALIISGRAPRLIVLENVCGALTSHQGKDFETLCGSLAAADYLVGAVVIDAAMFVPQSRPRLFVIGVRAEVEIPSLLMSHGPQKPWHTPSLVRAFHNLPDAIRERWVWWNLERPSARVTQLPDVVDRPSECPPWFEKSEVDHLLKMMTPLHRSKVDKALKYGKRVIGSVYKRTRPSASGKQQRAEIRFDNLSGCLRTPAGGSSRQVIVVVEDDTVKARLISARETARLMGLDDKYILPKNYNEAYHLTGDGVVVPAVSHLGKSLLKPLAEASNLQIEDAA